MSDDAETKLAQLLRRGAPAPTALDAERRTAIAVAARQAWFRAQGARRRRTWAFAAAACLVTGIAGWTLRTFAEPERTPAQPEVATTAEPVRAPTPAHAPAPAAERRDAFADKDRRGPSPPAPTLTPMPSPVASAPANDVPRKRLEVAKRAKAVDARDDADMSPKEELAAEAEAEAARQTTPAAPAAGAGAAAIAGEEAKSRRTTREGDVAATRSLPASPSVAAKPAPPIRIPADAPQRGRLLAANTVADAARSGGLQPGDRAAALRAALDLIHGIDHPIATMLRNRLQAELDQAEAGQK